jgi:CDP-diacylglycerol--serine O-phosphatidyltransferase
MMVDDLKAPPELNSTGIPAKMAAVLVYSRPFLVFGGMLCALAVIWRGSADVYCLGVAFLLVSMAFDLIDGWFAARFRPQAQLAPLADRIMDKLVYSTIFPVIAVGTMWRLVGTPHSRIQLLHAIFVLLLCVTVLIRDNFAGFMRSFALRLGSEPESREFTRLRTVVAAPVAALLYAYAFHIPMDPSSWFHRSISKLAAIPLNTLFFIEIVFLVINFGSIAGYCRKYGGICLDELCLGDQVLRRKILAVLPNALTVFNALMGLIGVFFAYQGRYREMYFMLIGAATFDKLDGALARRLGLTEPLPQGAPGKNINLGSIMDDFADAVSFCIAPAWIFLIALTPPGHGRVNTVLIAVVAAVYALSGLARLAYFTFDKHPIPGFFKGMPTPAAALLVLTPIVVLAHARSAAPHQVLFLEYFCTALMVFSSIIMNLYPIRYIHIGRAMGRHPWISRIAALLLVICAFTPYLGQAAFIVMCLYLFSPLVTGRVDPQQAARESRRG